jgi:thiol-disulfide isomerase/thioredoxin
MNKETFSLLIILLSISSGFSQSFNWVNDPEKGYSIPVGIGNYSELSKSEFYSEMEEYYQSYISDTTVLNKIKNLIDNSFKDKVITATIVFGGWCGDSKEHLPHFYKIISETEIIPEKNITLVGCDRSKKTGIDIYDKLGIELVPTFIFYIDGNEAGRIIETPQITIENDLLNILTKYSD